jgi:hypothetical protein
MTGAFLTLALILVRIGSEADGAFAFAGFARESYVVLRICEAIIRRQGVAQRGHAVYEHESGLTASSNDTATRLVELGIVAFRFEVMIVTAPEHK